MWDRQGDEVAEVPFSELVGKTLTKIEGGKDSEVLVFHTAEGQIYKMLHEQECCESVSIDDICGDLHDIVGSPILEAFEESSSDETPEGLKRPDGGDGDSSWGTYTWTFYKLATIKGRATIRWYGSSNGYYSERVSFLRLKG